MIVDAATEPGKGHGRGEGSREFCYSPMMDEAANCDAVSTAASADRVWSCSILSGDGVVIGKMPRFSSSVINAAVIAATHAWSGISCVGRDPGLGCAAVAMGGTICGELDPVCGYWRLRGLEGRCWVGCFGMLKIAMGVSSKTASRKQTRRNKGKGIA